MRPNGPSSSSLEALKLAQRPERINTAVAVRGSCARPVTPHGLCEKSFPPMCPNFLAGFQIISGDHFAVSTLFNCERQPVGDHEGGVAIAARLTPEQSRPSRRPIRYYGFFVVTPVPIR